MLSLKAQAPAEGRLDVTVVSAAHLPRMDTFGSCDGFVSVNFAGQVRTSEFCTPMPVAAPSLQHFVPSDGADGRL